MFVSSRKLVWVFSLLMALLVIGCTADPDSTLTSSREPSGSNFDKAAPAGYYTTADETNSTTLRASLHAIIDDHTRIPYTSSATDTWNVLEEADQDPNNASRVLDIYLNASYQKWSAGNTDYNREHSWPKSYGFPNDGSTNYPYTDCHHLFISNDSRNSSRSNKPYGTAGGSGTEYVTEVNNGVGGGSGTYPGWSNWASTTYWETWWDRRGDVARAMFYMDVRYEGGTHGVTGVSEPDLILTDNLTLIQNSNTGSNGSTAYMGLLAVLLQWHTDDPVDAKEMAHTDAVYSHQGNRNPFVDHPEWVDCIFNGICGGGGGGDTTPPAAPTGLGAVAGDGSIDLNWGDNAEGDLAGYTVFRGAASGGPYNSVNGTLLSVSQYTDSGLTNGTTYYYVVTASDLTGNESGSSAEASGTPAGGGGGGGTTVWINEFHYDNNSTDTGEFVEVAGTAGTNLSGWSIVGYNGNGGTTYSTTNLSGTIADQQGGLGTVAFFISGLQNGAPDGIALVDDTGAVVEFLSYEGTVNATNGPASGTASTNVGVSETSSTPVGHSLQLAGTGSTSGDFTWQAAQANTSGAVNTGQTFSGGGPVNQAPTAVANGTYGSEIGGSISFSSAGSSDADGTIVSYAWSFGDGGTSTAANPSYTYAAVGNYTVTLTVTDDLGAEGVDTTSASIVDTTAPAAPTGLAATAGNATVDLSWTANGEGDLDGYTVYRSTTSGGPYAAVNGALLSGVTYTDNTAANGTTYYYVVTASDLTGNESGNSAQVSALPVAPPNTAPTAVANGPYNGEAGVSVSFSSAGSNDPDGTIVTYAWAFGDGGTSSAANPGYTYAAVGNYTVTLTVTDDLGAEDTDTTSASIVDTTAPAAPSNVAANAGDATVDLGWSANGESDLDGYTVYRSTTDGGPYTALNGALLSGGAYTDNSVTNGTTYYYVVTASDLTGNESGNSAQVSALPEVPVVGGPNVWINEFHYDDSGSDNNERVEVAGTAGTSLSGWTVVGYNGNGGDTYKTWSLSGTLSDQQGGFGTKYIRTKGLQNGAPDGIALVDDTGTVVQFISYEGSFTATGGPAAGLTSTDVGVSESSSGNKNNSLQLGGTGSSYSDFTWQNPLGKTSGNVNVNQTFSAP